MYQQVSLSVYLQVSLSVYLLVSLSVMCVSAGITKCEVCTTEEMEGKGLLNRGFCFLTFKDHDTAVAAKKILTGIGYKVSTMSASLSFNC